MSTMRTVWNPWREMSRLRQELDHAAGREWWPHLRRPVAFPAFNALESPTGLTLTAELPGLDASQLDVHVDKDSVTVSGQRAAAPAGTKAESYVRRERWFEPFRRTIELPFDVDPEKCEAVYEKGILTLKLARVPEHQPKKLTIKAG
ncbi:MAG TPA: Hsp20/alpha crystallin family protein [Planctomycetaceae bacterium]|jgi:HSP20 family protein|nr:Hsp20/alpha crystallin family protein [Planctomycetaceae bacterium]